MRTFLSIFCASLLFTAHADESATFINLVDPALETKAHASGVFDVQFSPDGACILTVSHDRTVKLWDRKTGTYIATLIDPDLGDLTDVCMMQSVQFTDDGSFIHTESDEGTRKMWDGKTGAYLRRLPNSRVAFKAQTRCLKSGVLSHDGKYLLTVVEGCKAMLWAWDGQRCTHIKTLIDPSLQDKTHDGWIRAGQFSKDGNYILTVSKETVKLWDAKTGVYIKTLIDPELENTTHRDLVQRAQFSPDGNHIMTVSSDHTAKLWKCLARVVVEFRQAVMIGDTLEGNACGHAIADAFFALVQDPEVTIQDLIFAIRISPIPVIELRNSCGYNVLHIVATDMHHTSSVAQFLLSYYPALVFQPNDRGKTPFYMSLHHRSLAFIYALANMDEARKRKLFGKLSNLDRARRAKLLEVLGTCGKEGGDGVPPEVSDPE